MKRQLAATTIALLLGLTTVGVLSTPLLTGDAAWARAGGGSSGGSRGSRGFSAPSRPSTPSPTSPSRPATAPSPTPQRSGWGAGLMGGLGGLVLGGLLGSMLFGGMGGGFGGGLGGGFGLLEIVLLGALAYFAFSFLRRRREPQPAVAGGYGMSPSPGGGQTWQPDHSAASVATLEPPAAPSDLEAGIRHIRQMDAAFDPARMAAAASDIFFKVQAAWIARDMDVVRDSLTPEMHQRMQGQCADLKAQRRINRLENIAVRSTEVTEAWQEQGQDFVTVAFLANVLDYTTDESGQLVEGSRTAPIRFEEYWTFVRPVGLGAWRLSAIQQAG